MTRSGGLSGISRSLRLALPGSQARLACDLDHSPLASAVERPRLARPRAFHRSPPPSHGLGSHDLEHFTARLRRRTASARTPSNHSPLASAVEQPRLARPRTFHRSPPPSNGLRSHDLEHFTPRPRRRTASARPTP